MSIRQMKKQLVWICVLFSCMAFAQSGRSNDILFGGDWPFPLAIAPIERSCLSGVWIVGDQGSEVDKSLSLEIQQVSRNSFDVYLFLKPHSVGASKQMIGWGEIQPDGLVYTGDFTLRNGQDSTIALALLQTDDVTQLWFEIRRGNELYVEPHPLYRRP